MKKKLLLRSLVTKERHDKVGGNAVNEAMHNKNCDRIISLQCTVTILLYTGDSNRVEIFLWDLCINYQRRTSSE